MDRVCMRNGPSKMESGIRNVLKSVNRVHKDRDSGVYIAVFHMPRERMIRVGKLGRFRFVKGVYFYVGSAQRNTLARLERHSRKNKVLRWHIDYLSSKAEMLGVITIDGPRRLECQLAKRLGSIFELAVPRFGASDCRCGGHLFYASGLQ